MQTSPIQNRLGMVFVPVRDIARAAEWYSRLLGVPLQETSHQGTIYTVPMQEETGLILGWHVQGGEQLLPAPLLLLDVRYRPRLRLSPGGERGVVRGLDDIGRVTTLTFKDPDDNLFMVCQQND